MRVGVLGGLGYLSRRRMQEVPTKGSYAQSEACIKFQMDKPESQNNSKCYFCKNDNGCRSTFQNHKLFFLILFFLFLRKIVVLNVPGAMTAM